jgi:hypothetical protein
VVAEAAAAGGVVEVSAEGGVVEVSVEVAAAAGEEARAG